MNCICIITYILCVGKNPFDTLSCNKDVLLPGHFIFSMFCKHKKHIVIFTNSGYMSILNQVNYCLHCISYLTFSYFTFFSPFLRLAFLVVILNGLDLFNMVCDGKLMLSLDSNDGLLMIFLHLVCKLLSNMRKNHIAAVPLEFFCFWLLY